MIKKNSQSYRLMALVAMSGECSGEALGILMPQESYRKKLLMQLVRDKWIRLYEKDGLRGYRLSRRGKELLLQIEGNIRQTVLETVLAHPELEFYYVISP